MYPALLAALLAALLTALLTAPNLSQAQVLRSDLQPLPEPPPMPISDGPTEPAYAPQVTVRKSDGDTVEEYRVAGQLVMIRVTPPHGISYVLTDPRGDGSFSNRRDSLESPPIVPMWVLFTF